MSVQHANSASVRFLADIVILVNLVIINSQEVIGEIGLINKITPSNIDGNPFVSFGTSLDIFEDYAVIGAVNSDIDGYTAAGCAYIFKYDSLSDTWNQTQQIKPTNPVDSGYFGHAVSIYNNYIISGESGTEGELYVFNKNDSSQIWSPSQILEYVYM